MAEVVAPVTTHPGRDGYPGGWTAHLCGTNKATSQFLSTFYNWTLVPFRERIFIPTLSDTLDAIRVRIQIKCKR